MRLSFSPRLVAAMTTLFVLALTLPATSQQESKPLLSAEIRKALESDGVEGAQRRFNEIYPDQADRHEIDMRGLTNLATSLMAEDPEAGQAIMTMAMKLTRAQMEQHMPGMVAATEAQQREREAAAEAEREAAEEAARRTTEERFGPAREDLGRFTGYYGEPDQQDQAAPRNLFVAQTCDGYLVAGAMWGDAAPWYLTTAGETTFTYSDQYVSFTMEFEVDDEGNPEAMVHDLEDIGLPSPLPHVGELEDKECLPVERHGR